MSLFLALECSTVEGSLALVEEQQNNLNYLQLKKWTHQARLKNKSHSDHLPLEIEQILKQSGKKLSDLSFLCVGSGPGRFTGVRTALSVIRSLSFALNIPAYSINSLKIAAEPFLSLSQSVFCAFNGFKNQVYFGEFSNNNKDENICIFQFQDWCEHMIKQGENNQKNPAVCVSDLEDFYTLPEKLKSLFSFKKTYPHAISLAKLLFKQKPNSNQGNWSDLKAFYMRSPLD